VVENIIPAQPFSTPPGVDSTTKIPLQTAARMKDRDVIENTRRFFGYPSITVELTEDQYADGLRESKQWFVDNWGIMRFRLFDLYAGIREIQMTDDVREVQEVRFESFRLPPLVFDKDFPFFAPFPMRAEGGICFSYPTGLYSGIVQQLQWISTLKRIFSAEPDWDYDPITQVLRIYPAFEVGEKRMVVEYTSNSMEIEELFGEALITFQKYFRAHCKEILGQIRSKYDSLPVAGGTASLNGRELVEQGRDEKALLTEWAHQRQGPWRFLRG
jgi:hypothetical protein